MAKKTRTKVPFRRKREGRTDYKVRLGLLLGEKPRLVVRKSLKHIQAQLISYEPKGDKVLVTAHSKELEKLGWKHSTGNTPAAYLTGYLAGKKMIAKGIKETMLDIGLQAKGQRLFAVLKGAGDAGVQIPFDKKVVPKDERLNGDHISKDMAKDVQTVKEKIK